MISKESIEKQTKMLSKLSGDIMKKEEEKKLEFC